ncbi:hypothetical protein E2C01_059207 [Portunus trituberculatus]|uniref:Uncharacterized protein n=1 Tax=Portunus trituberculatus TaxID=210409 RepID=A0A5B7H1X5_PORTR|nr:hypothetical protein [Portunus trituberculatus]
MFLVSFTLVSRGCPKNMMGSVMVSLGRPVRNMSAPQPSLPPRSTIAAIVTCSIPIKPSPVYRLKGNETLQRKFDSKKFYQ